MARTTHHASFGPILVVAAFHLGPPFYLQPIRRRRVGVVVGGGHLSSLSSFRNTCSLTVNKLLVERKRKKKERKNTTRRNLLVLDVVFVLLSLSRCRCCCQWFKLVPKKNLVLIETKQEKNLQPLLTLSCRCYLVK